MARCAKFNLYCFCSDLPQLGVYWCQQLQHFIYLFGFIYDHGGRIGVNNYHRYMDTDISAHRCTHSLTHSLSHSHTRHRWRNLHFAMKSEQLRFSDFKRGVYILPQAMRYNFAEISVLVKFRGKMLDRQDRKMRIYCQFRFGVFNLDAERKKLRAMFKDENYDREAQITARSRMALRTGIFFAFSFPCSRMRPLRASSAPVAPEWPGMRG